MNEYLRQMIAHGHAEVETYPLAQLQSKVNQILNYRDFLDLLKTSRIYHPETKYLVDKITSEEN